MVSSGWWMLRCPGLGSRICSLVGGHAGPLLRLKVRLRLDEAEYSRAHSFSMAIREAEVTMRVDL